MHGKTSEIEYSSDRLFEDISNPFKATRYHSLVADQEKNSKMSGDNRSRTR